VLLGSSPATFTEQDIMRLKRLLAASGSSSSGIAGSMTDSSYTARPPSSTQSGTSLWVWDFEASFHMTSDSSIMSSLRPLDSPLSVLTADGTPLFVSSWVSLSTSFYVPNISHVPCLTVNLFSALTHVVSSFMMLIVVLFRIVVHMLWLGLALAVVIL
jgi:hypothetical protein